LNIYEPVYHSPNNPLLNMETTAEEEAYNDLWPAYGTIVEVFIALR
jgi:hypothetical protein